MKGERRLARHITLEVLYEVDIVGHSAVVAFDDRCREVEKLTKRSEDYARQLVFGILDLLEQLDSYIQIHASEWPLDQVAIVDRNLLQKVVEDQLAFDRKSLQRNIRTVLQCLLVVYCLVVSLLRLRLTKP